MINTSYSNRISAYSLNAPQRPQNMTAFKMPQDTFEPPFKGLSYKAGKKGVIFGTLFMFLSAVGMFSFGTDRLLHANRNDTDRFKNDAGECITENFAVEIQDIQKDYDKFVTQVLMMISESPDNPLMQDAHMALLQEKASVQELYIKYLEESPSKDKIEATDQFLEKMGVSAENRQSFIDEELKPLIEKISTDRVAENKQAKTNALLGLMAFLIGFAATAGTVKASNN